MSRRCTAAADYQEFAREVYPGRFLVLGDTGPEVTLLQTRLNQMAAQNSAIPTVAVDGVYGQETARAVRAVQRSLGYSATGAVGPVLWSYIITQGQGYGVFCSRRYGIPEDAVPFCSYRKNFRCRLRRRGLQMAMTSSMAPSTTPPPAGRTTTGSLVEPKRHVQQPLHQHGEAAGCPAVRRRRRTACREGTYRSRATMAVTSSMAAPVTGRAKVRNQWPWTAKLI